MIILLSNDDCVLRRNYMASQNAKRENSFSFILIFRVNSIPWEVMS